MLVREMISGDLKKFVAGLSAEGRPIQAWSNFDPEASGPDLPENLCLILGGMHGDEQATRILVDFFIALHKPDPACPVLMIPLLNPDGWERNSRYTANGVDLNRNFPDDWDAASVEPPGPHPLSEPESRLLRDLILRLQPSKIVTLHWALAELDADGVQSAPLAEAMWNELTPEMQKPYRLRVANADAAETTDAFCPGSLGRWCGHHLVYPNGRRPMIVTLELPYDPLAPDRPEPLPGDHLETLRVAWNKNQNAYLEGTSPGIFRMLEAACKFSPPSH